ncbi:MAG TPA: prenyltransferase [Thermoplasmata archaeon]|nr:prenyltransferase [Thermoplasmata archaeon]
MSEIAQFRALHRKLLGWFLEFRLIPVLLWAYTSVFLGTGVAWWERGTFDLGRLLVALALAGLVQGWVTHSVNEIYDWRSGTDQDGRPRALSGGSKVQQLGLLGERDLWAIFVLSTSAVALLAVVVALGGSAWLLILIGAGYVLGVAYTLPPARTAYRPFLGEWLGGFPGVLLAGLGAYGIQTGTLSWIALAALSAHALVCTAMLVMHHYQDAPADARARPPKRTTVVVLGPEGSRRYAALLATGAAALYSALALLVSPAFVSGVAFTLVAVVVHTRTDLGSLLSITRNELRIIQLGIAAGLAVSVSLAPFLWPALPLATLGYFVHLRAVAPPSEFARAWLPAAKRAAEEGNSAGPLPRP